MLTPGLSCHSKLVYTAGEGAPDTTCATLADTLPVSWTGAAGAEHGHDLSYKSDVVITDDICRTNFPQGRLCSASKLSSRREFENYAKRYMDKDDLVKYSTPSGLINFQPFSYLNSNVGHRGRKVELEKMTGNRAELDLLLADTMQERKR